MMTGKDPEIDYKFWKSPSSKAVFLLVHGLGAHAKRWEAMAEFFRQKGINSYAVELGDIDRPDSPAYRRDHFRAYYAKILDLYEIISADEPGKKVFLAGESLGGLISFLFASSRPDLISGLILISPAFETRYKPGLVEGIKMFAPLFYNPGKQFDLPFNASMCTRDPHYLNELEDDPEAARSLSSRLILEIFRSEASAVRGADKLNDPVIFLIAGDDKLVDPEAAKKIFNRIKTKDKKLIEFPGMYHSLSIELGREKVFETLWEWVEKRI